jgi:hypothetical protein
LQIIAPSINIPDPIAVTMKSSADETTKKTWVSLIDESVYTSDDVDIGDIDAVSRDFIVVKRGFVNIHYYYIPISKVEGWDGKVLWLKITEEEVIRKYQIDDIVVPDPSRYYVKDYPIYTTKYYPELTMIPSRYTRPSYRFASTTITATMNTTQLTPDNVSSIYLCDLCNESKFKTEDELSDHVLIQHK